MNTNRSENLLRWALAFECACGWGAFMMPATVFLPEAGPFGALVGIILATAFICLIGISLSYMTGKFPQDAGIHVYVRKLLGSDHGFLAAWAVLLAYLSIMWANATALVLMLRFLAGDLLKKGFHYRVAGYDVYFGEIAFTIVLLVLVALLAASGKKLVKTIYVAVALFNILMVAALFLGVLFVGRKTAPGTFGFADLDMPPVAQIFNITMLAPWMFVGFEAVTYMFGDNEARDAGRTKAIIVAAVATGGLNYLLLSLIPALALPEGFADWASYISEAPAAGGVAGLPVFYSVYCALGNVGLKLLVLSVTCAVFASLLGLYRVSARLLSAMSEEELLPKSIGKKDADEQPRAAIFLIMAISCAIPFFGRTAIGWIVDVTTISATIVYVYVTFGCFKLAREDKASKPVMKVVSAIGMLFAIISFLYLLIPNFISGNKLATESYFILAVWSITGYIYYWYVYRHDEQRLYGKSTVTWMLMLFLIFFSTVMWVRQRSVDRAAVLGTEGSDYVRKLFTTNALIYMLVVVSVLLMMFSMFSAMLRRQREADKKAMESEARDRAKTSFLFNMSHDIRTPMNAILGFTDLALLDTENPEKMENYLHKIRSSGSHLLSLINDVLEMSRIESGRLDLKDEVVNIEEELSNLDSIMRGQAEARSQTLTVSAEGIEHPYVHADRLRLNQVLLNLTSNAIKYTQEGGRIDIHAVEKEGGSDDALYELSVKDNGMGMSEEFASKIFEAFEREKEAEKKGIQGTGLGMAITKRIVDLMGGEISLDTKQGEGTEFTVVVRLKYASKEEIKERNERTAVADTDFSGKRVLLTDDVDINREIGRAILELMELTVEEAEDGEQAVEMVISHGAGYYDAVLLDIQMPRMNGYEAARAIRGCSDPGKASVPIIAMTANAFEEDIQNAKAAGMNGHVAKPIDQDMLAEELSFAFDKNRRPGAWHER